MPLRRLTLPALLLAASFLTPQTALAAACPAPGEWRLDDGRHTTNAAMMHQLADQQVVLLGEQHDRLAHHRWQLHTLSGLHGHRDDLLIGLEMLPRESQPALDAWVAGELSESQFLDKSGWHQYWGHDPAFYLPILHFARMQQIPLVALNILPELRQRLASEGWDSVPTDQRHHLSPPAAPETAYREQLEAVFAQHPSGSDSDDAGNNGLERFIAAQLAWDRAMAEGIADALERHTDSDNNAPLLVGLVGQGHLAYGHGVPHQLADLGVEGQQTLLTWQPNGQCEPPAGLADALYALGDEAGFEPSAPPRLGVMIEAHVDGVLVQAVGDDSIAERAGLASGDVIVEAAGRRMASPGELIAVVRDQPPGTLLPLGVSRDGSLEEVLARFPAQQ
ncbi:ChaN family lipoprotein [Halomonas sp. ML-15]|uniref:ChaN family lipoprotein n=1 Tax=Halomonas sp. ML-15 TaxID=2773305 RepID=UPI00174795EB|nr:ChaN family lipoprotein [Halomonas sp. ML-15]MBD3897535.1 ChaN family lipoprotein [Halomonas sp. ML-15]